MSIPKRVRFATPTDASQAIGRTLDTSDRAQDAPPVENISLERIEFDPDQPRKLGLNPNAPEDIDPADPKREQKEAQLQELRHLSESLQRDGQIQPVGVYLHGKTYRLIYGERRVLAARLAGWTSVLARIYTTRPNNLRAIQLLENLQRQDLALAERLDGMRALIVECKGTPEPVDTGHALGVALGMNRSTAYLYWSLLCGPEDVQDAIRDGTVTGLVVAADLVAIKDPEARRLAMLALTDPEAAAVPAAPKPPTPRSAKVGRPPTAIKLGRTKEVPVLRSIFDTMLTPKEKKQFDGADWNDFAVVGDIFQQMIQLLAKRLEK